MILHRRSVLVLALALSGLLAGCGVDPEPYEPPAPGNLITSPDQLVVHFQAAYEAMDADAYAGLLHGGFAMPLQALAAASYPDLGPAIEYGEAVRIHQRLFSRQPVVDPNQQPVAAVQAIAFQTLQKSGPWLEAGPSDAYPGTSSANYDVVLLLDRGRILSILRVQGTLRMHVAARDTTVGGVARRHHELRAITDLTYDSKAVETVSLGRLLGLWR